jgi:hypothetical protein
LRKRSKKRSINRKSCGMQRKRNKNVKTEREPQGKAGKQKQKNTQIQ